MNKQTIVGVIGAGTMGSGIAQVASASGHSVKIYDNSKAVLILARQNLVSSVDRLVGKQKISGEEGESIKGKIEWVNDLAKFADCGLVIEAIVENLDIKQKLFSELENIVGDDCILASNTSSLSITSIAAACRKPERVIGIHFFNPATLMPLVEIIKGLTTTSETESKTKKLIDSWNKTTVLAKDTPGFIVNRVARPYYGESIRIYEEGIADFATIDWALKEKGGFKMGPFELMDMIGNDVNYTVTETVWKQFFYDPRYKPSLTQKRLFEAGRFGKKSGQGYYDYSENVVVPEPKRDHTLAEKIFHRVIAMLINEAADALYYGVASKEDIDLAMTKGVNYPKGLLKWCDEIGAEKILSILSQLKEDYSEERYRPGVLLKKMVKEKKKFYS
ncbi:MAG: 3-hydroxyacyl-CoA dehydrogenase NAD-binding domain-containing protein [Bacteroidetes bacterium]|nr:3-hydroxyacyl-CoA dehydrogenase NAD-binding domain-containing protein [Bacteroidota bacterium]